MIKKTLFSLLFLCSSPLLGTNNEQREELTSAFASLTYYIESKRTVLDEEQITFSDQEINELWERVSNRFYASSPSQKNMRRFENAFQNFQTLQFSNTPSQTSEMIDATIPLLSKLWEHSIKQESDRVTTRSKSTQGDGNAHFENNSVIPNKIKKKMRPYVISDSHPQKEILDSIFKASRVTRDEPTFHEAGFEVISKRPRSYILVARHPLLTDFLVKAYVDSETRLKKERQSWEWLVERCIGAAKIRKIIKKKNFKHFTVASKWIYPLPDHNTPNKERGFRRHLAVLLVDDMKLVPFEVNKKKWHSLSKKEYLDELYYIISRAKGSSYRPDNIWYTENNTFAFIDTEYPSQSPDFNSIRRYLSSSMRKYWDNLVRKGG